MGKTFIAWLKYLDRTASLYTGQHPFTHSETNTKGYNSFGGSWLVLLAVTAAMVRYLPALRNAVALQGHTFIFIRLFASGRHLHIAGTTTSELILSTSSNCLPYPHPQWMGTQPDVP